ncbi:Alpha/Beta hydrolase protein [Aspergillus undulatus]|uniref:Alpha/Beta hydrolase protein n=1 Tax=Aspergillus undulatus TaxID=1810928 RepID=UPI003CCD6ABD
MLSRGWNPIYSFSSAPREEPPATVGLAISSSPLALLAWIGEKHLEWTDPSHPLPLDTILAMTSFYWFTSTFPRALYYADLVKNFLAGKPHPVSKTQPLGYPVFPYDLALVPECCWMRELFPNLVYFKRHERGGYFGALERPEAFLGDVEGFLLRVRQVVRG